MKIHISGNQVCTKRGLDAVNIREYFKANGCSLVENPQDADIVVALTCAFVSSYVGTAVDMVEDLKSRSKRIIVTGCLPSMAPEEFTGLSVEEFLGTKELGDIGKFFPEFKVSYNGISDALQPDFGVMQPYRTEGNCPDSIRNGIKKQQQSPYILRISKGCNNACSYCSHPAALGPLKSKAVKTCVSDYKRALDVGAKQMLIHANDPGAYGLDIGSTYPELLRELRDATKVGGIRWMLCDLSPLWLRKYSKEMLDIVLWENVSSMSVPLQSGSPKILKAMRRSVSVDATVDLLCQFRALSPALSIATHLIAGFPGETLEDIEQTVEACKKIGMKEAYIFRFSPNPSTEAIDLDGQLSPELIAERQKLLESRLVALGVKVDLFD